MPKAIITKFIPATNTKGARIKAVAAPGLSVTISYDYSGDASHRAAAMALAAKFGWPDWDNAISGLMPDNSGFAFVKWE